MRITKINNTIHKLDRPFKPILQKKKDLMIKCNEIRHKQIKDLSVHEAPIFGAFLGLFTPIPFGFLVGYGIGKLIEIGSNLLKKK